jgi:hypothetical protein
MRVVRPRHSSDAEVGNQHKMLARELGYELRAVYGGQVEKPLPGRLRELGRRLGACLDRINQARAR